MLRYQETQYISGIYQEAQSPTPKRSFHPEGSRGENRSNTGGRKRNPIAAVLKMYGAQWQDFHLG